MYNDPPDGNDKLKSQTIAGIIICRSIFFVLCLSRMDFKVSIDEWNCAVM